MESEIKEKINILESKFHDLERKIDIKINNEQLKVNSIKKKFNQAVIGTLIIASVGYGCFQGYKAKLKEITLFENFMYYQIRENETLEGVLENICKESYSIDNLVEFNKKYDIDLNSTAEQSSIIRFPKKYVKNSNELVNFNDEIYDLNKDIEKNRKLVDAIFSGNITKQKIDDAKKIIRDTNSEIYRIKDFQDDEYFKEGANSFIKNGLRIISEIEEKISLEIKNIDYELNGLYKILENNEWNKPGTVEKLDYIALKNNEIKQLYDCFDDIDRTAELNNLNDIIINKKQDYFLILDNVKKEINKDRYLIQTLQKQANPLLKSGLQNRELSLIKNLKEEINQINNYNHWKNEKRLEDKINDYVLQLNSLNSNISKKFNYAVSLINTEIKKYEDEISYGEKTGRINNADARLNYIVKEPLTMVKQRCELLGYNLGTTRTNKLINKINYFIKK